MTTPDPTQIYSKVVASTLGAAVSTVIVWLVNVIWNKEVPSGVNIAFATIATFLSGYLTPERVTTGEPEK